MAAAARAMERHRRGLTVLSVACIVGVALAAAWVFREPRPTPDAGSSSKTRTVAGTAPRPDRRIDFAEGCLTSECHTSFSLAGFQHAAVAESACSACHAPDSGGHVYPLLSGPNRPKDAICASCHTITEDALVQHRAMSADGCLACHDPHVSHGRGLLRAGTMNETCAGCHPRSAATNPHKPYAADRCDTCHEPHGSSFQGLLTGGEGANHCRQCHAELVERVESSTHSHCDIERGCQACHDPHGSDQPHLLPAPPRDLCVTCHPNVAKAIDGALVGHDAVLTGEQCITCHDPHASNLPKMLRDSQTEICLGCHAKPVKAAGGRTVPAMADAIRQSPVLHGAIRHGDCSACHAIHGGSHAKLLREESPNALLAPGEDRTYALCFGCHDPTLLDPKGTTQFRDGPRNLHEIHLRNPKDARGCGSCHAAHGGTLPRLIAATVNFQGSGWAMPMKFELTEDGGSCAPGCHEKLSYRRQGDDARPAPTPSATTPSSEGRSP